MWRYLAKMGVTIPERTDCAWCLYSSVSQSGAGFGKTPLKCGQKVLRWKTHWSYVSQFGRDTWPASMEELGKEFAGVVRLHKKQRDNVCRVCSLLTRALPDPTANRHSGSTIPTPEQAQCRVEIVRLAMTGVSSAVSVRRTTNPKRVQPGNP